MDVKSEGAKPLTNWGLGECCRHFRALEIKLGLFRHEAPYISLTQIE